MIALLIFIGFAVGTLVGLTGVGGGSIMTPLLIYIGLDPLVAVGTDLAYNLPSKLFGWYLHGRQGTIRSDVLISLLAGGIPASLAGILISTYVKHAFDYATVHVFMQRSVGITVIASALMVLVAPLLLKKRDDVPEVMSLTVSQRVKVSAVGAIAGLSVSLTSLGGGALALPLLILVLPTIPLATLVGTDLGFNAVIVLVSLFAHFRMGNVSVQTAVPLGIGGMVGVFCGTRLSRIGQTRWLRPAVAAALVVVGSRLM